MARMNSIGESESPCLTPRKCLMGRPGLPFRSTLEEEDARSCEIQRRHRGPNPNTTRSSRRNAQDKVSKALEISSFSKIFEIFFLLKSTSTRWTYLKLSWMNLRLVNAF